MIILVWQRAQLLISPKACAPLYPSLGRERQAISQNREVEGALRSESVLFVSFWGFYTEL